MDNSKILDTVVKSLQAIDGNASENTCPESYDSGKRGGCFALHIEDEVVAEEFYSDLLSQGFTPKQRMRQDYLTWSGILTTPKKDKNLIFNVQTIDNAVDKDDFGYILKNEGYSTVVIVDITDNGGN